MSKLWILAMAAISLATASPAMAQKTGTDTSRTTKSVSTEPVGKSGEMVDINSASKDELQELKGVGATRANAIIKGRPYKSADELVHRKILPQNVYDGIKTKVVAKAAATSAKEADAKPASPTPLRTRATGEDRPTAAKAAKAAPADEFKAETEARKHCPSDTVVWVNTDSKIYHYNGASDYGKTKQGAYMCQKESDAAGFRAARNEKAPAKN
ncbi:MAG: helix-hairpin-helix domain-containing protein [Proteobacteria bacterium]|nr:helix-hairpin-helix domain-containing protein [Pseudomonadota bacterium]